jgi:phage baseplate assembly protein W
MILLSSKYKTWSDLDLNFSAHPNTKNLSIKKDADAIARAVRYLVLTNHYERPFHPEIGSNLIKQLFEPMGKQTTIRIKENITETINNFEPRVQLISVTVGERETENGYLVSIKFFILNQDVEVKTQFFLERTR